MTVSGTTAVDADIADYVRGILGEGVRTEGWSLAARAGNPHELQVTIVVMPEMIMHVIERLLPHVRRFTANLIEGDPDYGFIEINAALMVDVRDVIHQRKG